MIDCVKVQAHLLFLTRQQLWPLLALFGSPGAIFWGWGQAQKLFWDLPM